MLDNPTELIQSLAYGISAIIGVATFLMVTLPNIFKKSKPLRAAVGRLLESESSTPAPTANGNGSGYGNGAASLALATLGQAHQNELARLAKAFEDFVEDNTKWRRMVSEENERWKHDEFGALRAEVTGRFSNIVGRLETLERAAKPENTIPRE